MTEYLSLQASNCRNCYKCIRHCPVKSIGFSMDQANIVTDECILCGRCFVNCPQNAKQIRRDTDRAKELIASGSPVWVSVAPSFAANWEGIGIRSLDRALRALGFAGAEETARGATLVKERYDQLVDEEEGAVVISSCCHTVNLLIQKYYPGALPYLARVLSPMQAHCREIKARDPEAKTVFVGPCISKKAEAESYGGLVDCVLTFSELAEWLEEAGVELEPVPDEGAGGKARLFPTTGGILRSMAAANPDCDYIAIDGLENCMAALEDISEGKLTGCFVEMSACVGSCVGGPVMSAARVAPVRHAVAVRRYAGEEDFEVESPEPEALSKEIAYIGVPKTRPGKSAVEEVLRQMGKTGPEHELNCGTCGYETCRDKAVAVLQGKANLSMCLPYLKEKAESFSDHIIKNTPNGILVLNESLEVQQINAAACRMMNLRGERDVLGSQVVRILDPGPFFEVMQTGRNLYDKQVYLADYRRHVEMTVLLDRGYDIIIVIMRDITEEEEGRSRREEMSLKAIEITDKVIDKQMRTVQEIASLLGETTAETKIALSKLKETLQDE